MKIAHIVCTYPPYYGGMGAVAFHMAESLMEHGDDVMVFTPKYSEVEKDVSAYVDRLEPTLAYGNGAFIPSLYKKLDTFDVVHMHYPFFGVAGGVYRWKKKHPHIPLVITYHMDARSSGLLGLYMKWYSTFFMPRILRIADAVTVGFSDYAEASQAAAIYTEQKEKWHEIPFGVDTNRFSPEAISDSFRITHTISKTSKVLLFVGGMDAAHYFKGVPVLLRTLQQLRKQGEDVVAVLVGDGPLRSSYELKAAALGISKYVTFAGHVSDEALPSYYASADVTVLPSTTEGEAFGIVLLESMACGTPVVASDLAGVRTLATQGGRTAKVNDPIDLAKNISLVLLETNDDTRASIRNNMVAKYSWSSVTQTLQQLYRSIVHTNTK